MDNIRFLENKYKDEIERHIIAALPNLYGSFIKFRQADSYEDGNLSFDLVFNSNFTISIRIRQYKYIKFNDMTIRYRTKQGKRTEFDKIKDGLAQIYFYAYECPNKESLIKVRMANVDSIRELIEAGCYITKQNYDGTMLAAFKFKDINSKGGAIYKYDKIITPQLVLL